MKMTYRYISCITAEWKLPSVVKNSSLMRPNTSGALHTSSCNQGSTAPHKWPFYMTVLWTDLHYTDNHSPHCCDVLRPPANRAASEAVVSHKRRGIPSAQALRCLPNTWRHVTDVQQWLREWRLAINVSKNMAMLFAEADRRIPKTRPVQLLGSQSIGLIPSVIWRWPSIHGFYLVDSYHLVEKESGALLLNRRSGLSTRNGVLLYKQLIRPMMDYSCPVWRSASHCHIRKMAVLQSTFLCVATNATWYIGSKQIHENLGVPFLQTTSGLYPRDSSPQS